MFSMEKKTKGVLSDDVIHNLDSHLDEARRQIQEARAKLHSEPLPPFAEDEEEVAEEAMEGVDELIKIPSDLLPAQQSQADKHKEEAISTINQLLHQEEQEEQELMRDLSNTIAEVDGFTQHF